MPVGKDQEPALTLGLTQQVPLLLQGFLGGAVKGGDGHQVEMMGRGNEVPQEHHPLAAMVEHDHLVALGMAVGDDHIEPGHDLGIAIQQFQLTPRLDGQEIVRAVHAVATLIGVASLFPTVALDVIFGLGEGGHQVAGPVQPGATARMVKMQMG